MCVNMHLCVCAYAHTHSLTPMYIATFPAKVTYGAVLCLILVFFKNKCVILLCELAVCQWFMTTTS